MAAARTTRTRVGVVGGGPAGLLLAHLLGRSDIDCVVVENRTRADIESTHRAGILEQDSVRLLVDSGVGDRVLREGHEHRGISLRFAGESHRIDFDGLVGASTWLYPQTDVFTDLADALARDGGDVRFGVSDVVLHNATTQPRLTFTDPAGEAQEVVCELLVGADGSRSIAREEIPETSRRRYFRKYPFAWFGILAEAPRSAPELIYARSERGFALVSSRTETLQRMYFQCDPGTELDAWSDDRIWEELQGRLAGHDDLRLVEGPIVERSVLPFRSFVQEPMRHGRLLLTGDAAHTVPPTGAKGLNLALADVRLLAEHLQHALGTGDDAALDDYSSRALGRVWRAQHFSYWLTTLLHTLPRSPGSREHDDFDDRRQLGELEALVASESGRRYLAEGYTGWPGQEAPSVGRAGREGYVEARGQVLGGRAEDLE